MIDVVRKVQRELTEDEKRSMEIIKDMGNDFIAECNDLGGSRELSLAITKMEEAVMWCVKHITR